MLIVYKLAKLRLTQLRDNKHLNRTKTEKTTNKLN